MKKMFRGYDLPKPALIIGMLFFTIFHAKGQQIKPAESGYAPVMALKFITKYMVRAGLSFYCMVLFTPLR
jgi:hypothetical protein